MSFFSDFTAHHKLGLIVFLGILALLVVHEFHTKGADLSSMEALIAKNKVDFDRRDADNKTAQSDLQKQLAQIAAQRAQVVQVPSSAPTIIRETIPMAQPIQQIAPITAQTKPTDIVGQLTLQQEQDLANFGLSCKTCDVKLATLQGQDANKDLQIKDLQGSLKKAEETAKGGSPWKRALKIIGVVGCAGGGAWLGSKAGGGPKGAAIGGALATTGCALKFHF